MVRKNKTYKKKKPLFKGGNKIKYYLIHGPNEERKTFMLDQFAKFGIDNNEVTWMESLNRDSLTKEFIDVVCTNPDMTPANVSVTLNHYMALRDIVKNQYSLSVIMEDDIYFKENVPERLNKYLQQLPDDWGVLFESDYLQYNDTPVTPDKLVYKKSGNGSRTTSFYMITLATATKLCQEANFIPFNNFVDHYYNTLFLKCNINSYWSEPTNVYFNNQLPSTVNKGGSLNEDIKIFVIHYSKLDTRKKHMEEQLASNNLEAEFVSIKDAEDLNSINIKRFNSNMSKNRISLASKSLYAYNEIKNKYDYALIFEDDTILVSDFKNKIKQYISELPSEWDICYIGDCLDYHTPKNIIDKNPNTHIFKATVSRCASAYLINKKTATIIVDEMNNENYKTSALPQDHLLDELTTKFKFNIYWSEPAIAKQGSLRGNSKIFNSTLGN